MSYKNSAGVKFNDATELIIRADPDGTVESCFNLSNNTEYVHPAFDTFASVTITNNTSASRTMLYCNRLSGIYLRGTSTGIGAGNTSTISPVIGACISMTGSYKFVVVSGEAEIINNLNVMINGDCVLTVENA